MTRNQYVEQALRGVALALTRIRLDAGDVARVELAAAAATLGNIVTHVGLPCVGGVNDAVKHVAEMIDEAAPVGPEGEPERPANGGPDIDGGALVENPKPAPTRPPQGGVAVPELGDVAAQVARL